MAYDRFEKITLALAVLTLAIAVVLVVLMFSRHVTPMAVSGASGLASLFVIAYSIHRYRRAGFTEER